MRSRFSPLHFALALLPLIALHSPVQAQSTITIDTTKQQKISPYIYGANFPDWDKIGLPFPLARQGGNRLSAYNWENNASNAGADWHHQNDSLMGTTDESGYAGRIFLQDTQKHGATALLTIPMTGYVAADKKGDGDVAQTPNYLETRFFRSLPKKPGPFVYPPDTTDRVVYQDEYVAWLEKIKKPGSTIWYSLDNEPDIWSGTHARIVPEKPTYKDFIARSVEYASAIKAAAPKSLVTGPANYGWQGFRRFQDAPDANGRDFLDVYLSAMRDAEKQQGKRLLDVLDIHFYPEARGDGIRITDASDKPGTALARIQAPRSLWDPTYVEDSWITQNLGGKAISLLPGIQRQIATHYPGTKLAISEYNYGGGNDISGAIAQADVLGIYGRYGVFASCYWGSLSNDTAIQAAFRAFLNYDGQGSHVGDLGLAVAGETPAADSVYAALDSHNPKQMTLVVINKTAMPRPMHLQPRGFSAVSSTAYIITRDNLFKAQTAPVNAGAGAVDFTAPALSISTLKVMGK